MSCLYKLINNYQLGWCPKLFYSFAYILISRKLASRALRASGSTRISNHNLVALFFTLTRVSREFLFQFILCEKDYKDDRAE